MTKPVKTIRRETGLIEGVCEHGVGHPLYGSVDWMRRVTGQDSWDIHGCDDCCTDDEWKIVTLRESVEIANQIIIDHKNALELERARVSELEDQLPKPSLCEHCGEPDETGMECCEDCSMRLAYGDGYVWLDRIRDSYSEALSLEGNYRLRKVLESFNIYKDMKRYIAKGVLILTSQQKLEAQALAKRMLTEGIGVNPEEVPDEF